MRGGSGNFGVVTALELRLHEVSPEILGDRAHPRLPQARETLRRFRDFMVDAPEEISLAYVFLTAPDEDGIPDELREQPAVAIAGMHAGALADAEEPRWPRSAKARRSTPSSRRPTPTSSLARRPAGLPQLVDRRVPRRHRRRGDRRDGGARRAAGRARRSSSPPGAARSPAAPRARLTGRGARFVVHPLLWEDAADDARNIAHGRRWRETLAPYRTGATYLNFVGEEGADRVRAAYGPHYERLARVKAGWDPDNVFQATGKRARHRLGKPLMCSRRPAGTYVSILPRSPEPQSTSTQKWTLAVVCAARQRADARHRGR